MALGVKGITRRTVARWPRLYVGGRRAYDRVRRRLGRPHEADFAYFARTARRGLFLDVGANNGISALTFRMYDPTSPIVSIEPNALMRKDLDRVQRSIEGFTYHLVGAAAGAGEFTLYTPQYRGTPLTGEASLERPAQSDVWWMSQNVPSARGKDFTVHEQQVKVIPLDDLELAPAWIKIDVEGGELDVLRGLRRTLELHRPGLLVERSDDFDNVLRWLAPMGYRPFVFRAESGHLEPWDGREAAQNVFLETAPAANNDAIVSPVPRTSNPAATRERPADA